MIPNGVFLLAHNVKVKIEWFLFCGFSVSNKGDKNRITIRSRRLSAGKLLGPNISHQKKNEAILACLRRPLYSCHLVIEADGTQPSFLHNALVPVGPSCKREQVAKVRRRGGSAVAKASEAQASTPN